MNRTFLTKSLVSLVILTKKAQSKGMFLDIHFIFLTKNYYFLTTFQKIFLCNHISKTPKILDLTFLNPNFKWIHSRNQHFKWTSEHSNIKIFQHLSTLYKILWKSAVCNKKINFSIYKGKNIRIYSEIWIYSKCSLLNKYIHIYIQTRILK